MHSKNVGKKVDFGYKSKYFAFVSDVSWFS